MVKRILFILVFCFSLTTHATLVAFYKAPKGDFLDFSHVALKVGKYWMSFDEGGFHFEHKIEDIAGKDYVLLHKFEVLNLKVADLLNHWQQAGYKRVPLWDDPMELNSTKLIATILRVRVDPERPYYPDDLYRALILEGFSFSRKHKARICQKAPKGGK